MEVISGAGKVIAYGSMIANGSQDPTTFEMQSSDALLGPAALQHDATLPGDGTAAAPLGLADGAVTLAKIGAASPPPPATGEHASALASATPKVLTSDGVSLSWQPPVNGDVTGVGGHGAQRGVLGRSAQTGVGGQGKVGVYGVNSNGDRFRIAGGIPGIEVSWQLTARRSDPGMRRRGFEVEREKPPVEPGSYLDPAAYGQPEEAGVEWALRPETMRQLKARREAGSPHPALKPLAAGAGIIDAGVSPR